jgi:hypothetical protein
VLDREPLHAAARDQACRRTPEADGDSVRDPRASLLDVAVASAALRAVRVRVDAGCAGHRLFETCGVGARHGGRGALVGNPGW